MINFAPATSHSLRFGVGDSPADKAVHLQRLRDGLSVIDAATRNVSTNLMSNNSLEHDGTIAGHMFTRQGFAQVCSRLSPNSYSFIKGLNNADMAEDDITTLQTHIFNEVWNARGHELDGSTFLVDSTSNKIEAIQSATYGHVSNVDALDMTIEQLDEGEELEWYKLNGRSLDVGISEPDKRISIPTTRQPNGETITAVKYLQNSEDGTSRFQLGIGLYTFICTNGMRIGKEFNLVSAVHRANIVDNIRKQLGSARDFDMSHVFNNLQMAAATRLTDELREKSYTILRDTVGKRQAKAYTSDEVAFGEEKTPTIYEVFSAMTQDAHARGMDMNKQVELENLAFRYMNKALAAA
jgi:hypothetical protein